MKLYGSLSILWHCLSLGLEWKLTFSSPVAAAEFSIFSGILSAALSQHHLLVLKYLNWDSITSTSFVRSDASWGPLDFTFQDVWLSVSDHTIVVIWVMYNSFVYSCHLFLISSASVRSIPFLSFIEHSLVVYKSRNKSTSETCHITYSMTQKTSLRKWSEDHQKGDQDSTIFLASV